MIYLDTSVVVAFYVPEKLSAKAERAVRSEAAPAVSDLTVVELASALARKVREGAMSAADGTRVMMLFLSHLAHGFYTQLALHRSHYRAASDWIGRFDAPLRTLDALHLAVAAGSGATLVTADRSLAKAAVRLVGKTIVIGPR